MIQKRASKIVRELSLSDLPLISKLPGAVYRRRLLVLIGGALASAAICLYVGVLILASQVGSPWVQIAITIPAAALIVVVLAYRLRFASMSAPPAPGRPPPPDPSDGLPALAGSGGPRVSRRAIVGGFVALIGVSAAVAGTVADGFAVLDRIFGNDEDVRPAAPAPSSGAFASPINGQEVSARFVVAQGKVEGLSSTSRLVCIVKNELSHHFVYLAQSDASGHWWARIGLGPAKIDRPFPFTLILATATQFAVDELDNRREADPKFYDENGIGPTLPSGIEPLARIVIVRTP